MDSESVGLIRRKVDGAPSVEGVYIIPGPRGDAAFKDVENLGFMMMNMHWSRIAFAPPLIQ